jgi:HEAT repeat protein
MLSVAILLVVSTQSIFQGDPVEKAWTLLEAATTAKAADQRSHGVEALGSIRGNRRANKLAEKALSDSNSEVRSAAATALGQMKDRSAIPELKKTLDDPELKVVLAAANSLYQFKDPAAYEVYYAILSGKRKASGGLIKSQLDRLHNRAEIEKLAFETGLGFVPFAGMGLDVWKQLTADRGTTVKIGAAEKLASDPDVKSGQALVDASNDNDWRVRDAVANAIGRRGDPRLLGCVSSMLLDTNSTVRLQAAAAVIVLTSRKQSK